MEKKLNDEYIILLLAIFRGWSLSDLSPAQLSSVRLGQRHDDGGKRQGAKTSRVGEERGMEQRGHMDDGERKRADPQTERK